MLGSFREDNRTRSEFMDLIMAERRPYWTPHGDARRAKAEQQNLGRLEASVAERWCAAGESGAAKPWAVSGRAFSRRSFFNQFAAFATQPTHQFNGQRPPPRLMDMIMAERRPYWTPHGDARRAKAGQQNRAFGVCR